MNDDKLCTPIYLKNRSDTTWPEEEKVFYLLSGSGLFLCRDHAFFRSCVPARDWPSELAPQRRFLDARYPRLPRRKFELVVGFFDRIAELHGSEAAVLMAWDGRAQRVRIIVPDQVATVSRSWYGNVYPVGLHYENPANLPPHWTIFGDIHSHVDDAAYASLTDKDDEAHRAGLHIVVGRIRREPPDLHIEAVVDGCRFPVDKEHIIAGYERRRLRLPRSWLDRVQVELYGKYQQNRAVSSSIAYSHADGSGFKNGSQALKPIDVEPHPGKGEERC